MGTWLLACDVVRSGGSSGLFAAACKKMDPRRVSWSSVVLLSWCGMFPRIASKRLTASAMTASYGVIDGFEIHLCLLKTVATTLVAWDSDIQMIHA